MDQNPIVFDEAKKNEIYEFLADYYLKALEDGNLDIEERQTISGKILQAVDNAKSFDEVLKFVDELSQKYPFFLPVFLKLKGKQEIVREEEIINKLDSYQ